MPNRVATDDDWDDDEANESWSDDANEWTPEEEDDDPTTPCPHCHEPIHVESEQCPHCGQYVSEEDAPPSRKPWWIVMRAILCLFAVYLWIRS